MRALPPPSTVGCALRPPRPIPSRPLTPPRAFSRVPFESLDFGEPAPRRRRRRRRGRRDDEEGDEEEEDEFFEEDDDGLVSPLAPDRALCDAALPGTQVARLKDLQAESEARRDAHFAMYRAHSWKANLLSSVVLVCTTAGGTSGLISLTSSMGSGGGGGGGGVTGFSGVPMAPPGSNGSTAAALLSPILGYAATLFSGWQQYAKPSTTASRHLTAAKRYTGIMARHVRDTLQYGVVANYARVIQAVEKKLDQYDDESPVIDLTDGPPKSAGAAFVSSLFELPDS